MVTTLPSLHVGGKIVMMPNFEPKSFLAALEKTKVRGWPVSQKQLWTHSFAPLQTILHFEIGIQYFDQFGSIGTQKVDITYLGNIW